MKKVELEILALSHSVTQSQSFAVILGEVAGTRRLPIVIGGYEAQAIAVALDNMKPSRPLTHDLMKTLCDTFTIELVEIFICKFMDGVFYSTLLCKKGREIFEIDSRTSDALALAARFDCPIFVKEEIIQDAGVEASPDELLPNTDNLIEQTIQELTAISSPSSSEDYSVLSVEELENLLQTAIENEDYERAARIRDEQQKRLDS